MPSPLNSRLLLQDRWDSAGLGVLGAVYHQFKTPGCYRCTVLDNSGPKPVEVGECRMEVGPFPFSEQVDIDLSAVARNRNSSVKFKLQTNGYASFFVGRGPGGAAVLVDAEDGSIELDSRALSAGDLFTVNILRPGSYEIVEQGTGCSRSIRVVDIGESVKLNPINPEPVKVTCCQEGLICSTDSLEPGDLLLVDVQVNDARILCIPAEDA